MSETKTPKLIQAAKDLRAIWKNYKWNIYLRSKERKRETEALWGLYTNAERLMIIKIAFEN